MTSLKTAAAFVSFLLSAVPHATELAESGFIRRQPQKKGAARPKKAKPLHFVSSDGYDIFVGKSNLQNDELTLRTAESTDIWMHAKNIPGSHVIIRTNGTE